MDMSKSRFRTLTDFKMSSELLLRHAESYHSDHICYRVRASSCHGHFHFFLFWYVYELGITNYCGTPLAFHIYFV